MARYNIPGAFGIDRRTFDEIDTVIRSLRQGSRQWNRAMNSAVRLMAHTTQAFALRDMSGPRYPSGQAWTIPVRVITEKTRRGWKVRQIAPGVWEVYNEERGAYMVEHGIARGGGGVRRPILKNAGVATLHYIHRTRFAQRIMADTFGSLRNNRGQFRSFENRIRPFELMMAGRRPMAGPQGRLPR